jgi:hypothetical protein
MENGKLIRVLGALALFGISFAYIEAAVVVYLRAIEAPVRRQVFRGMPHDECFPLLTLEDLDRAGPPHLAILATEAGRELATMALLASAGLAVACNFRQWLAAFMIAFGIWDIFYYVFLKLLLDWPASPLTWDILFLLPVPWVGPVLAPVLVAVSMIVGGWLIFRRESLGRPIPFRWFHWVAILGGASVIISAFCWDHENTMAGGRPNPFHWPLFLLGWALGAAAFLSASWTTAGPKSAKAAP